MSHNGHEPWIETVNLTTVLCKCLVKRPVIGNSEAKEYLVPSAKLIEFSYFIINVGILNGDVAPKEDGSVRGMGAGPLILAGGSVV